MEKLKTAVILLNLGGPETLDGVKPFLWNLFTDKHIIRLPFFLRYPLAWLISTLRTSKAQKIYESIGGGSPLNKNTKKQSDALEALLKNEKFEAKVFTAMRYAPPMTEEVAREVAAYKPDQIILLPLYPQFSTTTTQSSVEEWKLMGKDLKVPVRGICCYFDHPHFIKAHQELLKSHLKSCPSQDSLHILFSAHGLPEKIIEAGDPYAWQVGEAVSKIMQDHDLQKFPYTVCYQSKVGPTKWLRPSLEESLEECVQRNQGAVVVPIAFVSDHSETLYELDIQFKEWADEKAMIHYSRVPVLGDHPMFIEGLASLIVSSLSGQDDMRKCPRSYKDCCHGRFNF